MLYPRCYHHRGQTGAGVAQFLAPAINLPRTDICSTCHFRDDCARRKCRRHQRPLLLRAPAPSPLWAAEQLIFAIAPSLAPVQPPSFALLITRPD
jgi:hypothetical protein